MGLLNRIAALTATLFRGRPIAVGAGSTELGRAAAATEWQSEVTDLYNQVPELRYAIYWMASSASRTSLIIAKNPEKSQTSPQVVPRTDRAWSALLELAPTAPEQSMLIYRIVTLLKLVGCWRMVGFNDDQGHRRWIVASEYDHMQTSSGVRIHDSESGRYYDLEHGSYWSIPMYMPHPVRSAEADAPTRALIPTFHELIDLSGHVQTAAKSRLAGAGLLLMPNSLSPVTPGQSQGVNPPDGDPTMRALTRTAQAAIQNPNDVSRHLPVMIQGHHEALNAVRHLSLATPFDERVDDLRIAAVRRVAVGMDLPQETLTGMGELNHWTAWQVEQSGQRINIGPTMAFVCRELTVKFLHPALRSMGITDWESYQIWYDDAAIQTQPNRGDLTLAAREMGLISDDAARTALGFGPGDAPVGDSPRPQVDQDRVRARLRRLTDQPGPASENESRVSYAGLAADAGWSACADLAARRALKRCGQYLLGSGPRSNRGRYVDVPLDAMHTKISADPDMVGAALQEGLSELRVAAPHLVDSMHKYVRFRIETGTMHDKSEMCQYLLEDAVVGR